MYYHGLVLKTGTAGKFLQKKNANYNTLDQISVYW